MFNKPKPQAEILIVQQMAERGELFMRIQTHVVISLGSLRLQWAYESYSKPTKKDRKCKHIFKDLSKTMDKSKDLPVNKNDSSK